MISFTPLSDRFINDKTSELQSGSEGDFLLSYLWQLLEDTDESFSVAVSLAYGTLLCRRCFEGVYEFTLPYPYRNGADTEAALCALEEYARLEEIPLVLADLCAEDLDVLCERYTHPRVHALPFEEGETPLYILQVMTEAMLSEQIPTLATSRITLRAPQREDIPLYARLCRDEEILPLWGYDFRADYPDATDEDLFMLTEQERERGLTIPFFIYTGDAFVGEALLYAFDGRGGAECAVRLLPEHRRRGIATEAVSLLIRYAKETLRMYYLDAVCHRENAPSRALFSAIAPLHSEQGERCRYRISLS